VSCLLCNWKGPDGSIERTAWDCRCLEWAAAPWPKAYYAPALIGSSQTAWSAASLATEAGRLNHLQVSPHIGFINFRASAIEIVWPCLFFTCVMVISLTSVSS